MNAAVKQVEFYFSDKNYSRDAYLKQTAAKNEGGWIPLEVITGFNKMKELMRTLNRDSVVERLSQKAKSGSNFDVS